MEERHYLRGEFLPLLGDIIPIWNDSSIIPRERNKKSKKLFPIVIESHGHIYKALLAVAYVTIL